MFFSMASEACAEIDRNSAKQIKRQRSVLGWGIRLDGIIGPGVVGRRWWSTWGTTVEKRTLFIRPRDAPSSPRRRPENRKIPHGGPCLLVSAKKPR